MDMFETIFIPILVIIGGPCMTLALEPYDNFREGSCQSEPTPKAVPFRGEILDKFSYFVAGSKYHMHRQASFVPNYDELSEEELIDSFCYTKNATKRGNNAATFGFGSLLSVYRLNSSPPYLELEPVNPPSKWGTGTIRLVVTLTDNQDFAFFANCFTGSDQRSWSVISRTPELDPISRKKIEEHAISLGFRKENFVYLKFDSCCQGFGPEGK